MSGPPPSEKPGEPHERESLTRVVASARRGDRNARAVLHERFADRLAAFLRGRVGPKLGRAVSISDLCQESFLRSYDALHTLPEGADGSDFEAILYRNARWVVGSQARKHKHFDGESAVDSGYAARIPDPDYATNSGVVTREDEVRWLEAQVARLKRDQAAVVRRRLEGMAFERIAEELDISEYAARKRFLRGALELRRFAEGHRGD